MKHWICVPVKPFAYGKSRLATVFSDEERYQLNYALLSHTLQVISETGWKENVLVVSKGLEALKLAESFFFQALLENPPFGLNRSLRKAIKSPILLDAESITVIPADLPLISIEDMESFLFLRKAQEGLIIVHDRNKIGTNIFSCKPVGAIPFQYGRCSYKKHVRAAETAGLNVTIFNSTRLELDLDTESDLINLLQMHPVISESIPQINHLQEVILHKGA